MIYDKIVKLTDNKTVELALSFKEEINKTLALGMTRYVCRYGTLSDGHEKLTSAQIYFQAIKEMWGLGNSIEGYRIQSMELQADLMDAEEILVDSPSKQLRKDAAVLKAKTRLVSTLVSIEDLTRQLDEFNKVRLELKAEVEAKYPLGIEQAEEDNWKIVFEYRAMKGDYKVQNIPLSQEVKAQMGIAHNNLEAMAPLALMDKHKFNRLVEKQKLQLENKENK